jgi:hypothetical protein
MTDQLDHITRTKLTQGQKRGMVPGRWSQREYVNDRRNMEPVRPRPDAELRVAQSRLAELALDKNDPAAWLSDVLSALGLHRVISAS